MKVLISPIPLMRPPIMSIQSADHPMGSSDVLSEIATASVPIDRSRAPSSPSRDHPVSLSSHLDADVAANSTGRASSSEPSQWIASLTIVRSPPRPPIDPHESNDLDMHDRSVDYNDLNSVLRDTLDLLDGIHREGVINDLEMSCIDYSPKKDVDEYI
jgi:hypothetical protein